MGMNGWEVITYAGLLWACWRVGIFIGRTWVARHQDDEAEQVTVDNSVFVYVDPVTQGPHEKVLLIYNSVTNKFIGQSTTPEGVLDCIFELVDKSKQVYLHSGDVVVPLIRPLSETPRAVEPKDKL